MKKIFFAAILFPLFVNAQPTYNTDQDSGATITEDQTTDSEMSADVGVEGNTDMEIAGHRRKTARCGRHSDFKCAQLRVFDTCERDNSHGIYGSCRDIGKRDSEVICSCR